VQPLNIQPIEIPDTPTNLLNPAVASLTGPVGMAVPAPYILISHVRLINTTASPIEVSMWKGATSASAAGTEVMFNQVTIPPTGGSSPNYVDWYGGTGLRLDAADFLVGAGTATGVTANFEAEIGFA
jgi:hypothetical protein